MPLNVLAAVSTLFLVPSVFLSSGGYVVLSDAGVCAPNEQSMVRSIALYNPPVSDLGEYNSRKLFLGIYRIDWSGWHRGRKYIVIPSWVLFVASGFFPAAWAIRFASRRRREQRAWRWREQARCPGCGYDVQSTPDRCPECGEQIAKG